MMSKNVLEFTKMKHQGQTRKDGKPYYLHPLSVANRLKEKGFSKEYQVIGLCHDLLEDTDISEEELTNITNQKITNIVKLLTKEENYNMNEYVTRIKNNEIARIVKLADRIDNLTDIGLLDKDNKELKHYNSKLKYIAETVIWYLDLAKGTVFEMEIANKLQELIEDIKKER